MENTVYKLVDILSDKIAKNDLTPVNTFNNKRLKIYIDNVLILFKEIFKDIEKSRFISTASYHFFNCNKYLKYKKGLFLDIIVNTYIILFYKHVNKT